MNKVGRPVIFSGVLAANIVKVLEHTGGNVNRAHDLLTRSTGSNLKELSSERRTLGFDGPLAVAVMDGRKRRISVPTIRRIAREFGIKSIGRGRPRKIVTVIEAPQVEVLQVEAA